MAPEIHLINGSFLRDLDLASILRRLDQIFETPAVLARSRLDLSRALDTSRHQTNSAALLAQVLDHVGNRPGKYIAIVDVDLFIPILTFVFGEAQLGGSAAVVSTHRLSNQFYGLPQNDALMLGRLEKEIVHELGHTFGLYHCRHFECVMRSSTYVEEIDVKRVYPCPSCAAALKACLGAIPVLHGQAGL